MAHLTQVVGGGTDGGVGRRRGAVGDDAAADMGGDGGAAGRRRNAVCPAGRTVAGGTACAARRLP